MRILETITLLACLGAVSAQDRQGEFITAAPAIGNAPAKGGLFLVDPILGTTTSLNATGGLANSYTAACDAFVDDVLWVGTAQASSTAAPAIYRVRAAGGKILSSTEVKVGLTAADRTVRQVDSVGDELMFLTDTQLSLVAKTGGTPRVIRQFNNATGRALDFATNGHDVFLLMPTTATIPNERIFWFHFELPLSSFLMYTAPLATSRISSVTITQDVDILIVETNTATNAADLKQLAATGNLVRSFRLPFPNGGLGARIDDAAGVILVSGLRFDTGRQRLVYEFASLRDWKIHRTAFGTTLEPSTKIDVRRHTPLHRHGHACLSAQSLQRIIFYAQGQPTRGNNNYTLRIAGPANQTALALIGLRGQLANPIPLAAMGAGTCVLGVTPLVEIGLRLPSSGLAAFHAPIPANTPNAVVDVQWLVTDPGANRAGLLSSQVGSIVVR